MRFLIPPALLLLTSVAWSQPLPPVIDMHMHAGTASDNGPPPLALCVPPPSLPLRDAKRSWEEVWIEWQRKPPCSDPVWSSATDSALMAETLEVLERRNVYGLTSGRMDLVEKWRAAAPGRIIPSAMFRLTRDRLSPAGLAALFTSGRVAALAEVTSQYLGISPSDMRFDPYLAVAERLDIPVGIHIGTGPPGAPYLGMEKYRAALHTPLTLEDALMRHPGVRVFVMHAGWPMLDDMLAVLWVHPQVYVELGGIIFGLPRADLYRYLQRLVESGFGKRVMFGSDNMVWPGVIERGIRAVEEAPFLTETQKRDILYNNATRILRLSDADMARHHGR
ncbi:MAG: amidohydrolase family protein [Gemmatimonadaceae bacterium]